MKEIRKLANQLLRNSNSRIWEDRLDYLNNEVSINRVLKVAIAILREEFQNKSRSWLIRAIIRFFFVTQKSSDEWVVKGIPDLGDLYSFYRVRFSSKRKKYECSCFNTAFGNFRRKRICTHIAAVIIYRKVKSLITYYM